ncbi:DUF222 domain-containing protein [[Mycobacterium] kokjensenii]|uniref:DUF222 domain-containing protein n=1 Tax=[Mycobacterium] kokjensenii TaxID=3064287 RepID=A0ABM9LW33_9MYCO|nr:HNH endonuclease signature motif containing protein [Mycolicibacter sp. MU0083]CAJ1505701.1 DUF222 domain-containing protein [Mycolicibacter sp. MU0083]
MTGSAVTDRDTVLRCLETIETASAQLAGCCFDGFDAEELLTILARREKLTWQAPTVDHRILARLTTEAHPGPLGACSLSRDLTERLRISRTDARRRIAEAADLGPRTAMTGEPLPPVLPALAAAQAAGHISPEHITIARKAHHKIPATTPATKRDQADAYLATLAADYDPETFTRFANHLIAVLTDDTEYSDHHRHTHRGLRLGRQGPDGLSTLTGKLTPELRAHLEPILAKLAAPGMANSDDEHPCVHGTPTEEQIHNDHRRPDQRNHDALLAAVRALLASKDLGQLNGLPVTVIVTTTLAEIEAATGHPTPETTPITGKAHTAGDTVLPMRDLLRMAEHAYHYLAIFDGNGRALWLGRTKRLATADQRIVLHARDRGCTKPGCPATGYRCQAHHLDNDWAHGGHTEIDSLALACGPDNRTATDQHWTTRLGPTGKVEWIPPPHQDHGQPRTNPYHFIENTQPPDNWGLAG